MDPREVIIELLSQRAPGRSICPSEAARRLDPVGWRARMEEVRNAGRALARDGIILVTRKGERLDPESARGAIRYRLAGGDD